jgi:NADH-quinone oxidoreductase subunit J
MELRPVSSTAEIVAFVVFAAIALLGALATIIMRNPIRSALGLFVHIVALAGLYLNLGAQFLGVVQLIVYAGAVVVLFVFVIMLLGPAADTPKDARGTVPRMLGVLAIAAGSVLIVSTTLVYVKRALPDRPEGYGTLKVLGEALFSADFIPFELIGVTLVTAVVGAFAVARGRHKKRDLEADGDDTTVEAPKAAVGAARSSEGHS